MTRRAAAATTASPSGSRSSASGRRNRSEPSGTKRSKRSSARSATTSAADVDATATPRRTRAKRGQGEQLREQILDATYELLLETGDADKVSTRAVARRVGCSSPALYLHFPDRAALLWAVCNRQFVRLGELISSAVEAVDDPVEALQAAGRAYITFGVEHAEEYRVMMMGPETVVWDPPIDALPTEAGFDVLHGLITRAMADGSLREDDPTMVALGVWTAVHGVVALRIAKPSFPWPPLDEQIERTLAMVTGGLAPAREAAPPPRTPRRRSTTRRSAARPAG